MNKIEVTVSLDEEKYKTIILYLKKKGLSFDDEFDKALDVIFNKVVPKDVKEYITMIKEETEPAHPRRKRRSHEDNQPDNNTE